MYHIPLNRVASSCKDLGRVAVSQGRFGAYDTTDGPIAVRFAAGGLPMRILYLSAAAVTWLACSPRDNTRTTGAANESVSSDVGISGDTTASPSAAMPRAEAGGAIDSMDAAGMLTMLSVANLDEIHEARYAKLHAQLLSKSAGPKTRGRS